MSIWQGFDKNKQKPAYIFRVFDLPYIHIKLYESKLSTALSECKAVARCATRKIYTAINIKNNRMFANYLDIMYYSLLPAKCFLCLSPYWGQSAARCTNKRNDVWVARACSRNPYVIPFIETRKGLPPIGCFVSFCQSPTLFSYNPNG